MLYAIVFATGAAILALELLASRIMTPYFGVSLFIWTGILSITLVALAAGYWWGGRLTARRGHTRPVGQLTFLYAMMPGAASLAIVAACLLYPFAFQPLARMDLVVGAFAACVILLFVPLATTSAMNPLLVAIRVADGATSAGDAGAGRVFFISTLGSVAGVAVTAFGLIPNFSTFTATLMVAAGLAALTLAIAVRPPHPLPSRARVAALGGTALALSLALLAGGNALLQWQWPARYGAREWQRETTYHSMFGTVQILKSVPEADGSFRRMYFQDGITQNTVGSDGRSLSLYTYMLDALIRSYRPDAKRVLALGLGAGIVPRTLVARGVEVTVVEIDPAAVQAARQTFALPDEVNVVLEDARTYLQRCRRPYDVVVVDLFAGDGVPEYLVTKDFFNDLKRCTGDHGVAVFNTFADLQFPRPYAHFLATLRAALPAIVLYRPDYPGVAHVNSFVVAAAQRLPEPVQVSLLDMPETFSPVIADMLARPRPLDRELLEHSRQVTDALNPVSIDFARGQARHRKGVIDSVPAAFLFN
ncbi:MAG: spermidine synthase [Burkholderiales bacterium]